MSFLLPRAMGEFEVSWWQLAAGKVALGSDRSICLFVLSSWIAGCNHQLRELFSIGLPLFSIGLPLFLIGEPFPVCGCGGRPVDLQDIG